MPVYNVMPNCFKNTSDGFKSSNDRIEKLKAKTIYHSSKNTSVPRKSDGSKYNGPVFINTCGFLGSIGGFNNSNYNLRLNVAKGRAYSEKQKIITLRVLETFEGSYDNFSNQYFNITYMPWYLQNISQNTPLNDISNAINYAYNIISNHEQIAGSPLNPTIAVGFVQDNNDASFIRQFVQDNSALDMFSQINAVESSPTGFSGMVPTQLLVYAYNTGNQVTSFYYLDNSANGNFVIQQEKNTIFADQELCNTSTSKPHKANTTYDLLEGNFYNINKYINHSNSSADIICNYGIIKDTIKYSDKIISSDQSNNTYVSNLVNRDKLHNLNLNKKIQMCP